MQRQMERRELEVGIGSCLVFTLSLLLLLFLGGTVLCLLSIPVRALLLPPLFAIKHYVRSF